MLSNKELQSKTKKELIEYCKSLQGMLAKAGEDHKRALEVASTLSVKNKACKDEADAKVEEMRQKLFKANTNARKSEFLVDVLSTALSDAQGRDYY